MGEGRSGEIVKAPVLPRSHLGYRIELILQGANPT